MSTELEELFRGTIINLIMTPGSGLARMGIETTKGEIHHVNGDWRPLRDAFEVLKGKRVVVARHEDYFLPVIIPEGEFDGIYQRT